MKVFKLNKKKWNKHLNENALSCPFYNPSLIKCFMDILGGHCDFYKVEGSETSYLIPIFTGKPWEQNKDTFSTSSIGYGGPISLNKVLDLTLISRVIETLEKTIKKSFTQGLLLPREDWSVNTNNLQETYIINLNKTKESIFNNTLTGDVRTAIRKAKKSNIIITEPKNRVMLKRAHYLIVQTQLYVGSEYTTPYALLDRIFTDKKLPIKIYIAQYKKEIIGCTVLLQNKQESFHWLHGWDRKYAKLCANQLLMWTMIVNCIHSGVLSINLGSAHTEAQTRAKLKWGAKSVKTLKLSKSLLNEERRR